MTPAQKLQWKITPESAKDIEIAKMNIDKSVINTSMCVLNSFNSAISDCDHQILIFEDYGKGFVKLHKLSPDSFIQIAIQLTFYKYVKIVC